MGKCSWTSLIRAAGETRKAVAIWKAGMIPPSFLPEVLDSILQSHLLFRCHTDKLNVLVWFLLLFGVFFNVKCSNMPDENSSTIAGTCINITPLGPACDTFLALS